MPQVGNKKFPYTPSGIARANAIKKKLMGGSMKQDKMYRPDRDGKKNPLPRPGMDPGFGRRPKPPGGNRFGRAPRPGENLGRGPLRPKPPARPGMRPSPPFGKRPGGGRVPVGGGRRPNPKKRYPRLLPGRGLGKYL